MISVGIDISKEKSTVCMLRPYGEIVEAPFDVEHNEQALNALVEHIKSFDEDVKVVLEATGGYHQVVVTKLLESEIFTVVVNPYIMKRYCAASLRKAKTDKIDSIRIANYGIDHWFSMTAYCPPDEIYAELKLLGRQYDQYVRLKINCKIQLANLLDGVMPGIKKILTGTVPASSTKDKLCDFVEKYWHFDNIKKMSESKFVADYQKWAKKKGYRYSESQAIAIYQLSQNNIPTLKSSTPSTKMLVLQAVKSLRYVELTLSLIISQMQEIASTLPEYSVVREMKGVGEVLSVRLIAEIGDIRRFHNGSALVAFAGIDAPPYGSGKFVGTKRNISKRGSATLRKSAMKLCIALNQRNLPKILPFMILLSKKNWRANLNELPKSQGLTNFFVFTMQE